MNMSTISMSLGGEGKDGTEKSLRLGQNGRTGIRGSLRDHNLYIFKITLIVEPTAGPNLGPTIRG